MMLGGSGGKLVGIGPVDEVPYTMQFRASIDDGGHRPHTTAMGPYSRLLSIQQSTMFSKRRATHLGVCRSRKK
jgi:hypothetical protein